MPEDIVDTTAPEAPETVEPTAYEFPFEVPDFAGLTEGDLMALAAQVREHAETFAGRSPAEHTDESVAALAACRDLAVAIAGSITGQRAMADQAAAAATDTFAALDALSDPDAGGAEPPADPPPVDPAPNAVTATVPAARRAPAPPPRVREVAANSTAPQLPVNTAPLGSLTAATDAVGFRPGQQLESFDQAATALSGALDRNGAMPPSGGKYDPNMRPITVYDENQPGRVLQMRNFQRSSVVQLRREFPSELRVSSATDNGYAVAEFASSERRLPGGNLRESARLAVKQGRSLTAAIGWCAPAETIYDLIELESLDGMLDSPELQTPRGSILIPTNGGPDFATIYGLFTSTHRTEDQVIAGSPAKTAVEIPCPDFGEVTLGVDYISLTGSLLQRRGYPEAVKRFTRAAMVALAHRINQQFIAAIVAGSGAANVIPADPSGDDAASALLATIDLAIVDAKYRNRMTFNGTMEVVLPWWVLVPIRAALSRRTGVAMLAVTDAQILEWFTIRGAVPRFVYDWQDAFSGVAAGPGGSTPLKFLPATVNALVYPAGTWVKAVQDVIALDTIYDSTLLQTNQYQAVFVEDGWAALKMNPISRLYTIPVDPSGVTGCCPNPLS